MKRLIKIFAFALVMLMQAPIVSGAETSSNVCLTAQYEQTVKACSSSGRVYANLIVEVDDSGVWVVGRDKKRWDSPVQAYRSNEKAGYTYVVSYGGQTWYFNV